MGIRPLAGSADPRFSLVSLVRASPPPLFLPLLELRRAISLFFFDRLCEVHRRLVHVTHHKAIASRAAWRALRVSLRGDSNAHYTVESKYRKAERGAAPHGDLQTGRHDQELLFQVRDPLAHRVPTQRSTTRLSVILMTSRPRCKAMPPLVTRPIQGLGRSPPASPGTTICLQPRLRTQKTMLPRRIGSSLSFTAMSTKPVRDVFFLHLFGCLS